jgi:hypothetical protein
MLVDGDEQHQQDVQVSGLNLFVIRHLLCAVITVLTSSPSDFIFYLS